MIIYTLSTYVYCYLFWVIFFSNIFSTLQRRWSILQNVIFCVSHRLGLPGISLMCLSIPFFVRPRASIIIGTGLVLRWHNYYYNDDYLLLWEFFTPVLANGFSLEFEWQQVFSNFQDSSQYFWPILVMLYGWSLLALWFLILQAPLSIR